ncbi:MULTISPECIES: hypothetical protein [unclassified Saccharopolyspora]|uniref:hypothetical protein n=1 Tax=unclassified Saccharopolyspora TaxID=2646250 RepID=UPI001CD33EC7|nr:MULTISPECIES: hypothetical protein [unclassified Saccharopolyspora]MCA1185103.1 hypothetical protein [Saccharopolyspora sp. 6T]MCA1278531.1 hypothetical protein [Saccharopolyspora sp. 7B]
MGATLRIESLAVEDGRGWQEPYDLSGRLVSVRARVRIGDEDVVLHRSRRKPNTVDVRTPEGSPITSLPIRRQGDQQELSDWLLARLGLDDAFASVRLARDRRLSFAHDLLPYLHIRQDDSERFIIRPRSEDAARRVVAALLLGLTSERSERLRTRASELHNLAESRRRDVARIRAFLDESPATESVALDADLARLRDGAARAARRLRELREQGRAATRFADHLRKRLEQARERLSSSEDDLDRALRQRDATRRELAHLDASLAELAKDPTVPDEHGRALPLLRYDTCTACGGDLSSRVVPPGRCSLCTEPLPDAARAAEAQRLRQRRQRVAGPLAEHQQELDRARAAVDRARQQHADARTAFDGDTSDSVAPHVDAIAAATAELESLRARITVLERIREPHERLVRRQREIEELEHEHELTCDELDRAEAELTKPEDVLQHIDDLFRRIVDAFDLPWSTGRARLHPETLLPMVDEQDFGQRGGGSRTAVSVAYSLALLMHALEDPMRSQLPTLLVLDSPQKNMGRNDPDQDLVTRMYTRISDYFEERRRHSGGRFENVQLIIVDNDIPAKVRDHFRPLIEFEGDEGFIRDLENPHGLPDFPEQLALDLNEG